MNDAEQTARQYDAMAVEYAAENAAVGFRGLVTNTTAVGPLRIGRPGSIG